MRVCEATVDTRETEMSDICNKVLIENSQDLSSIFGNFFGTRMRKWQNCFNVIGRLQGEIWKAKATLY